MGWAGVDTAEVDTTPFRMGTVVRGQLLKYATANGGVQPLYLRQACLCSMLRVRVDSVLPVHNNPFAVSAAAPLM